MDINTASVIAHAINLNWDLAAKQNIASQVMRLVCPSLGGVR
jgi:hypothetical protein